MPMSESRPVMALTLAVFVTLLSTLYFSIAMAANASRATKAVERKAASNVIKVGWTHIRPQESNGAPRNQLQSNALFPLLGVREEFRSEGVRLKTQNVNTLALTYERFLTKRVSLTLIAGFPRKASIQASGEVAPTGPVAAVNNINLEDEQFGPTGRARLWAPALTVNYLFGSPGDRFRPFAGMGISYAWFTEEELNDDLARAVNQQFGLPLALFSGASGETSTDSYVEAAYAPVFLAGITAPFSPPWQLDLTVSYVPLSTTANVIIEDENGAELGRSRTRINFDPFIFQLTVGYRY